MNTLKIYHFPIYNVSRETFAYTSYLHTSNNLSFMLIKKERTELTQKS